jgi:hypothetical protein
MSALFDRPFLTERFDSRGGGIDFLRLRQVNLTMLQDDLIPGLNNQTADFGTFCIGAWIPWKFQKLCRKEEFMRSNYTRFREAMEVAMAFNTRDDSPAERVFGRSTTRMGTSHRPSLPGPLTFAAAQRTNATSLYAAPLYGPALRYLGLLQATDAVAEGDYSSTRIPLASDDECTQQIASFVETSLAASSAFQKIVQLKVPSADAEALDSLGECGLHPSYYRRAPATVRRAFLQKLFAPDYSGQRRQLTAALIRETVEAQRVMADNEAETVLRVWYTNLLDGGRPLVVDDAVRDHRLHWAVFQARQIQRTVLELFLRCFELAIGKGRRDVEAIIEYWRKCSPSGTEETMSGALADLIQSEAREVHRGTDFLEASRAWNTKVHGEHRCFDDIAFSDDDDELLRALRMLARWWLRLVAWLNDRVLPASIEAGQRERVSIGVFHRWIDQRLGVPVREVLRDVFSDFVFAQHVKAALIRFDGEVQRLRFTLGDEGIMPTVEVGKKLGEAPNRMADRLASFISLLCDVHVLQWNAEGQLVHGVEPLGAPARPLPILSRQ